MALLDEETLLKYNLGGDRSAGYTGTTYGAGGSGIIPNLQGLQSYNLGDTSGMMSDPLKVAASFKPKVSDTPSGFGFNNEKFAEFTFANESAAPVSITALAFPNQSVIIYWSTIFGSCSLFLLTVLKSAFNCTRICVT